MHLQIKREVRKQLENKNELETITIPVNSKNIDFKWVKPKKEFRYKGNLYDISSQQEKEDNIIFLVYNDKDEKRLYQTFAHQLSENKNPFHQSKPAYPLKNFIKEALILSELKLNKYLVFSLINTDVQSKWSFALKQFSFAPNSPPPQLLI